MIRGANDGLPIEAFIHRWKTQHTETYTDSNGRTQTRTVTGKVVEAGNGAPIGSQRKRAATFAAYRVETVEEFARGTAGSSRIVANKDKGGNHRKGEVIGELHARLGENRQCALSAHEVRRRHDDPPAEPQLAGHAGDPGHGFESDRSMRASRHEKHLW